MIPEMIRPAAPNELLCTRLLDAPRELVFQAWTQPERLAQWWGEPGQFSLEACDADLRPGGAYRKAMRGGNGALYIQQGKYIEIDAPARLVYTEACDEENAPFQEWLVTVTFDDYFGQTLIAIRAQFEWTAPDAAWSAAWMKGQREVFSRLASHADGTAETAGRIFELKRAFDAPRALVFDAWVNPKHMARWWGPLEFENPVCQLDPQPGGAFRIVMRGPDGGDNPMKGHYLEVTPHERLVFTDDLSEESEAWHDLVYPDRDRSQPNPGVVALTSLSFTESAGKTEMTVLMTFDSAWTHNHHVRVGMTQGWLESFTKLEALLAAAQR